MKAGWGCGGRDGAALSRPAIRRGRPLGLAARGLDKNKEATNIEAKTRRVWLLFFASFYLYTSFGFRLLRFAFVSPIPSPNQAHRRQPAGPFLFPSFNNGNDHDNARINHTWGMTPSRNSIFLSETRASAMSSYLPCGVITSTLFLGLRIKMHGERGSSPLFRTPRT